MSKHAAKINKDKGKREIFYDFSLASKKVRKIKKIRDISLWVLIASMIVIVFMSSFSAMLYNERFYNDEYTKNGVYERYGENMTLDATANIFSFFKSKEEIGHNLGSFFTDNEKSHMYDVKALIGVFNSIYYAAIFLSIAAFIALFFYSWNLLRDTGKIFLFAGLICLFLVVMLYTLNFDFLFDEFHKIFFTGNYAFPEGSNLIGLFPMQFFGDIAYRIFFLSIVKTAIFIVSGICLMLLSPKQFSEFSSR